MNPFYYSENQLVLFCLEKDGTINPLIDYSIFANNAPTFIKTSLPSMKNEYQNIVLRKNFDNPITKNFSSHHKTIQELFGVEIHLLWKNFILENESQDFWKKVETLQYDKIFIELKEMKIMLLHSQNFNCLFQCLQNTDLKIVAEKSITLIKKFNQMNRLKIYFETNFSHLNFDQKQFLHQHFN